MVFSLHGADALTVYKLFMLTALRDPFIKAREIYWVPAYLLCLPIMWPP